MVLVNAKKSNRKIVYVVECKETGLFKIGITAHLAGRLAELNYQSAYPLKLAAVFCCEAATAQVLEKILHGRFAGCRTHGEWFKLKPSDLCHLIDGIDLDIEVAPEYNPENWDEESQKSIAADTERRVREGEIRRHRRIARQIEKSQILAKKKIAEVLEEGCGR